MSSQIRDLLELLRKIGLNEFELRFIGAEELGTSIGVEGIRHRWKGRKSQENKRRDKERRWYYRIAGDTGKQTRLRVSMSIIGALEYDLYSGQVEDA